jgi:hypothetical protein
MGGPSLFTWPPDKSCISGDPFKSWVSSHDESMDKKDWRRWAQKNDSGQLPYATSSPVLSLFTGL